MSVLELRFLGGCEGTLPSGAALQLPTRKAWALLAYLALHSGREISRERLAALLWGQRFDEQARASLRQALYELRSALGAPLAAGLVAKRDCVTLQAGLADVDARRLEEAVGADPPDLVAVAARYQGPLLDGLETGEPGFDEWLAIERARLHDVARRAMEHLAGHQLDQGQAELAVETARRLVRLDPWSESAHRLLMRGLAATGRRSDALRQYRELERLLHDELAVAPDAETLALRDQLRRNGEPAITGSIGRSGDEAGPPVAPPHRRRWQLIATAAVVLVAIVVTAGWLSRLAPPGSQVAAEKTAIVSAIPRIAVLPVANLADDPEQRLLADGLTEDLISALSKTAQLVVIPRMSVAAYRDQPVKAQTVAAELGVDHVLEGAVQEADGALRITVRMVDAPEGRTTWSERFDRAPKEIFELQDDIVRRVLVELQVQLTDGEHARVASRGTTNLDAWLLRLQAMTELYKFTRESTVKTRELLEAAHELDPEWSRPLGGIAWSYWWEARQGWTDDRDGWIRTGVEFAERAIELDPNDTLGYMQLGNLMQLQGDHERAIALRQQAVDIAPNDFQANWGLGSVLVRAGETARAIEVLQFARRLNPRPPAALLGMLSQAQLIAGDHEGALEAAEAARARAPDRALPYIPLAAAHSALRQTERARAAAASILEIDPAFSVSGWKSTQQDHRDQEAIDRLAELLTAAGLPD